MQPFDSRVSCRAAPDGRLSRQTSTATSRTGCEVARNAATVYFDSGAIDAVHGAQPRRPARGEPAVRPCADGWRAASGPRHRGRWRPARPAAALGHGPVPVAGPAAAGRGWRSVTAAVVAAGDLAAFGYAPTGLTDAAAGPPPSPPRRAAMAPPRRSRPGRCRRSIDSPAGAPAAACGHRPFSRSACGQRLVGDASRGASRPAARAHPAARARCAQLVLQPEIALEPRDARARPLATAAFTAQRGSSRWRQSREAAGLGERFDVVEGLLHRVADVPQLQLAHAGRVDQQPAARHGHQLAMRGGVPPLRIALPHLARRPQVRPRPAG